LAAAAHLELGDLLLEEEERVGLLLSQRPPLSLLVLGLAVHLTVVRGGGFGRGWLGKRQLLDGGWCRFGVEGGLSRVEPPTFGVVPGGVHVGELLPHHGIPHRPAELVEIRLRYGGFRHR
jgi:hypothetical protein